MSKVKEVKVEPKFSRNKILILSSIAVAVIIAIVVALIVFLQPPVKEIRNSETYKQIASIATVDGVPPASIVITPPSEKWWNSLLNYTSNTTLGALDYKTIGEKAQYLSFSLSNPKAYSDTADIGVPTTYIVYSTKEAAAEAATKIPGGTTFHVQDNMIIFVAFGAFIDVDYSVDAYKKQKKNIDASDMELEGKAVWEINVQEFNTMYSKVFELEEDQKVYDTTLTKLGITDDTKWVGTSTDGLNWSGKVSEFNGLQVKGAELMEFFATQERNLNADGSINWTPIPEIPEEEQSGVITQRQANLQNHMVVKDADGKLSGSVTSETGESIKADKATKGVKGATEVIINPNSWLSFMSGRVIAYPFSYFQESKVVIDGTNVNINLTPGKWDR